MVRKILAAIVLIPLAILIVAFAVANRQAVTVSFDPFDPAHPAYAVTLPLFVIVFALVILGVIVGGIASWLRQAAWRHSARRLDSEVRQLRDEVDKLQSMINADAENQPAGDTPPPGASSLLPQRMPDWRG